MRLKVILRLISALIFATFAAIFSQVIPPIPKTDPQIVRLVLTLISAWIGFLLFPDIARYIRVLTITTFNFVVHRVSAEIFNQLLKLPKLGNFPFGNPSPQIGSISLTRPLILDTSAIIDGRILDVSKTGFVAGLILIPRFVLGELQQVADSSDDLKRGRGRRGFEVVEELKKVKGMKIEIWDKDQTGKSVDDKLLNLAKSLHGKIITTDFNLNKVASVSNITVLNVNDLANAVKTALLPGEKFKVKIVHIGKDPNQGIGYLPDGTMVVVSDAANQIGGKIELEVTKTIQGPAGRMIFGKITE